jgi:hypothetical protein
VLDRRILDAVQPLLVNGLTERRRELLTDQAAIRADFAFKGHSRGTPVIHALSDRCEAEIRSRAEFIWREVERTTLVIADPPFDALAKDLADLLGTQIRDQAVQIRAAFEQAAGLGSDPTNETFIQGKADDISAIVQELSAKYDAEARLLAASLGRARANPPSAADRPLWYVAGPVSDKSVDVEASPQDNPKVFVVHGHDLGNTLLLEDLLKDRFHLDPVRMAALAGLGRTLVEKFEQAARPCGFAFVVMTPDDFVVVEGDRYAQPRPNVLFELGWFYGHLGRSRVVLLLKKGTRVHSDLDGISQIVFREKVTEVFLEIETEIRAAGLISMS